MTDLARRGAEKADTANGMKHVKPLAFALAALLLAGGASVALAAGPLDGHPPRLELRAPEGPVRGAIDLGLVAEDPQGVTLSVSVDDGAPVEVGPDWTLDTTALADGPHTVAVVATDRSWRHNAVRMTAPLQVDNRAPEVAVHTTGAAQGRTAAFFVATDEPAEVTLRLGNVEPELHPVGEGRWRALVGFAPEQPAGKVTLGIIAADVAGNVTVEEVGVPIEATPFESGGYIVISPEVDRQRRDVSAITRMRAERDAASEFEVAEQLWAGPMLRPVSGRRTSSFGKFRTYSDGGKNHHNGVDIANVTGTPVVAAAAGLVTLARQQPIYGNVVIVSHGHGVATSYNHLDAIDVAVGERVEAGQVVGRLGSTGNSTGPHLHWGLTVDGVAVDAEQWLDTGFELTEEVEAALGLALTGDGTASD